VNYDFRLVSAMGGIIVLLFWMILPRSGNWERLETIKMQEQQQKTEYMQLCADEGIAAFHCLNNWMEVQP